MTLRMYIFIPQTCFCALNNEPDMLFWWAARRVRVLDAINLHHWAWAEGARAGGGGGHNIAYLQ